MNMMVRQCEFEGSDDSMEGDDTLFDPEAIRDVMSVASSDDESIETLSASNGLSGSPPGYELSTLSATKDHLILA